MRGCLACDDISILHENTGARRYLHVIQSEIDEQAPDALVWLVLVDQDIFGSPASRVVFCSSIPVDFAAFPSLDLLLVPWRIQQRSERGGSKCGYQCHDDKLWRRLARLME